jgi:membrane-associated phospholipid phosphatase
MEYSVALGRTRHWILVYLAESWIDLKQISKSAKTFAREKRSVLAALLLLALGSALALWPWEMTLLHAVQGTKNESLVHLARQLSYWGDLYTGTVILFASLWLVGLINRQPYFRNAAIACLLAAILAGLFTDIFRYGLGRPRPKAGLPDGLYGLQVHSRFHGFPSGHTTTAFGTAVSIAVLFPATALPGIAVAASVGWSRMYLNYHRPTDVLVGSAIGSSFGWAFGAAARRRALRVD